MAMDYLPAQASSVASEHVFSSSAETDTKLKKAHLDFTSHWSYTVEDAEVDNAWEDRSGSIGVSGEDQAFYTLLDLLEEEVESEENDWQPGVLHNDEGEEVFDLDAEAGGYSDEWVDE
ncbi:hypothetical protein M422DRAFT_254482 [Sphaerobolus stellatus SS14]|uniref:Uncharacterized protein n=1 Tax=Sphaerobolus stellatus (strain SS14) TaxID=990650 RepID=A0A0C9VV25_SPHS4|nr:hypothetical protein M422DRAFT_254482 [Sphaerobolus stellatus SS14]